ncbi:RNA-directed DNA polymerase, eukaryota [Tanacetum coccineum]|uniref:RNA-directed DNA polymerase, eukaryota n=1 Tax=Tanacetum coccineum TaxID=301880 RepID=A0ABQ5HG46_9ASTR
METLHISFSRAVNDGIFKGVHLHGTVNISHIFYADDAMFIGEWSGSNLQSIVNILNSFFLASGLKINILKSQVMGVGVPHNIVVQAVDLIGCTVMRSPFCYLGVMVGECMSRRSAWASTVHKLQLRFSKWKVKTLSIGGRLTLLKSVLGASPLYNLSIFKVPKGVLKDMESIRSHFFNGADSSNRKITWVAWDNPELFKLLSSHNFASCLPTELKELSLKFTELSGEIKELKNHVKDIEIELPGDLKEIPTKLETFTSTISSLTSQVAELKNIQWELTAKHQALPVLVSSVQKQLKTLDSLPSLLNKVTETLNRFATIVENASEATTKDVPLAGQATASPSEGEKNTNDAETNLKDELVDLLGTNVCDYRTTSMKLLLINTVTRC